MESLTARLQQAIRAGGPMPFPSFMAAALYDPADGYYTRPGRTGRDGDFYTSVSVGPVFGELMAGQFCAVWEAMGRPAPFHVLERGANDGRFAADVLTWAERERPDFAAALRYVIDEPLAGPAAGQRERLAPFAGRWQHGAPQGVTGVFFANELLDAVPFRRVARRNGTWVERCVGLDADEHFTWVDAPLRDRTARARLESLGPDFPEGYETEVSPAAASEVRLAAAQLAAGALFFVDYGFTATDYYDPLRTRGTLRCYRGHRAHEDPFEDPGETDITAHVDFSFMADAARASGCAVAGFVDQGRFLTGAAADSLTKMEGRRDPATAKWCRQFQTLVHPGHLGRSFHVLTLTKGDDGGTIAASLTGLRHAGPPAV